MFVKLLKHEWRASRGLVGLLCAIIAISGLLLGGSLRYSVWSTLMENSLMVTVYAMIVLVAELAILGCVFLAMYFLAYRFYKSRFEDQGYLMLTLPVTTHEHLLSSIVNTIFGVILVGLTAIVSTVVAMSALFGIFRDVPSAELWPLFTEAVSKVMQDMGLSGGTVFLLVLNAILSFLSDLILFMLALTVGSQARKHPVLKGAAVYIITDIVVSGGRDLILEGISNPDLEAGITCVVYILLALGSYFVMHHIIEKKLNLT